MRIGVLTGGGDVPGLNPCIKAIVNAAQDNGWEVYGFRRGWAGPLNINPDDAAANSAWIDVLTKQSVRTIDRTGGTILHTSRTNPKRTRPRDLPDFLRDGTDLAAGKTRDCTAHVLGVMEHLGIDALVPIGGDDTLSYAAHLSAQGFPMVAVPKTMDNDVFGTEYCIGFSTAVSRSVDYINNLRTPAGSHERVAVIELFGRNSGESALYAGYLADADRTLIAEVPFNIDRLATLVAEDRRRNPSRYAVVVVSEGAPMEGGEIVEGGEADAYGHRKLGGIGEMTARALKDRTGIDFITQRLAYLMRAGAPDGLDRLVASSYGHLAVQQLEQGKKGVMMAIREGKYDTVPIDTCTKGKKRVPVEDYYDREVYRPRMRHLLGKPLFL